MRQSLCLASPYKLLTILLLLHTHPLGRSDQSNVSRKLTIVHFLITNEKYHFVPDPKDCNFQGEKSVQETLYVPLQLESCGH